MERTDVARLISRDGRGGAGPASSFAEAAEPVIADVIAGLSLSLNGDKGPVSVSLLAKKDSQRRLSSPSAAGLPDVDPSPIRTWASRVDN